jgi:hypothetical protein
MENRAPERLVAEYKRRFDTHDLAGLVELRARSCAIVDHRKRRPERDGDGEYWHPEFASTDVRIELDELGCANLRPRPHTCTVSAAATVAWAPCSAERASIAATSPTSPTARSPAPDGLRRIVIHAVTAPSSATAEPSSSP